MYDSEENKFSSNSTDIQDNSPNLKFFNKNSEQAIRFTTDVFPKTLELYSELSLPLSEQIIPVIRNEKNQEILRCNNWSCRTFINPFFVFTNNGEEYYCNICGSKNQTPKFYFCKLENNGDRRDKYRRIELLNNAYDLVVGSDFMKRFNVNPVYLFLLDVSSFSKECGLIEYFSCCLREAIQNNFFYATGKTQIGIIGYDSQIYLFDFGKSQKQTKITVISEKDYEEEPNIINLTADPLVFINDGRENLLSFLDYLPKLNENQNQTDKTAFKGALGIALKIIGKQGGKLIILQANDDLYGSITNQNKENNEYKRASSPYFACLSSEITKQFVSVNIFCYSKIFKNIINIAELCRYLHGDCFYYNEDSSFKQRFFSDFRRVLVRDCTWEGVFRVRVSKGWQISGIWGNYSVWTTDLITIPNTDETKTLFIDLKIDEDYYSDKLFIQTCLLYTSSQGDRRVRCFNHWISVSNNLERIFNNVDENIVSIYLIRRSLSDLYKKNSVDEIRKHLFNRLKIIFKQKIYCRTKLQQKKYMKNAKINSDSFINIPLYILGALKNPIFNSLYEKSLYTDVYNSLRVKLLSNLPEENLLFFSPRLYILHNLCNSNFGLYNKNGQFVFPMVTNASIANLEPNGLYLLDKGDFLVLYIRKFIEKEIFISLFTEKNLNNPGKLNEENIQKDMDNPFLERFWNLISEIRRKRSNNDAFLYVALEGEASNDEKRFIENLIEDKNPFIKNEFNQNIQEFMNSLFN